MTKKQTFGFIGGAAVVAIGVIAAVNYSSANKGWPTQGAIGQREVYRDNAAKPEDVAVAPGSSPVADQANHQLKRSDLTSGMKSDAVSSQMASSVMVFMTSNASDAAKLQLAADFMSSSSSFAAFTQSNRVMNAVQSNVVANAVKSDAVANSMHANISAAAKSEFAANLLSSNLSSAVKASFASSMMRSNLSSGIKSGIASDMINSNLSEAVKSNFATQFMNSNVSAAMKADFAAQVSSSNMSSTMKSQVADSMKSSMASDMRLNRIAQ